MDGLTGPPTRATTRARRWFALFVGAVAAALLVPFIVAAPAVDGWFASFEDRSGATWGVAVIVVALLAVDIAAPIPSSLVAAFAGVAFGALIGSLLVFVGLSIGCALGYVIASSTRSRRRSGGRGASALECAGALRGREGALALVLTRPVPLLAEATVIVAGLTAMRRSTFVAACCVGNVLVAALFAWLPATLV